MATLLVAMLRDAPSPRFKNINIPPDRANAFRASPGGPTYTGPGKATFPLSLTTARVVGYSRAASARRSGTSPGQASGRPTRPPAHNGRPRSTRLLVAGLHLLLAGCGASSQTSQPCRDGDVVPPALALTEVNQVHSYLADKFGLDIAGALAPSGVPEVPEPTSILLFGIVLTLGDWCHFRKRRNDRTLSATIETLSQKAIWLRPAESKHSLGFGPRTC